MMSSLENGSGRKFDVRIVVLGLYILAVMSFVIVPSAKASTLGYYERHTYTWTIPVGDGVYHQYQHQGAVSGSMRLISSTGIAGPTYAWNAPWLFVSIVNGDTKPITVVWEETFYVV